MSGVGVAQTPRLGLRLSCLIDTADCLYSDVMSRLRRLVLSDRFFFLTVRLLPRRRPLDRPEFAVLSRCFSAVRSRQGFLLTAWVFLPDHWHAILYSSYPLTISAAMKSVKLSSSNGLGGYGPEAGELWQGRFFDRALRTVKEYMDTLEYISPESGAARSGKATGGLDLDMVELS